ncbi:MAG: trypsin-like serine protease [Myxococcota bacterium]
MGSVTTAQAAELTVPMPEPDPIWGGTASEDCAWPTTVFMEGCTGTLVHPEVVVLASHCLFFAGGQAPAFAEFGTNSDAPDRQVPVDTCTMYPGWQPETGGGIDVAFCTLSEPVLDVPIVPILMGCETEVLGPGQEVTLVGYGITDSGSFGIKHEVVTTINNLEGDTEVNLGGNGTSSCNGDSGGPAYLQLEDGSWRVFGVTSRGTSGNCADESIYGRISPYVEWMEDTTGIDVTPCHDVDGTWNPSDACTEFPLEPGTSLSGWEAGCAGGMLSGPAATCGDPFGGGEGTGTGTTGDADTGLDGSGGDSGADTELPGGTTGDADTDPGGSSGSTGDTDSAGQDDTGTGSCSCQTDDPGWGPLWMLPALAVLGRRRRR